MLLTAAVVSHAPEVRPCAFFIQCRFPVPPLHSDALEFLLAPESVISPAARAGHVVKFFSSLLA